MTGNETAGSEAHDDSDPIARVERLVAEGMIDQEAVIHAERLWSTTLANGFLLPNGESGVISCRDRYHLIVDSRIRRKPGRIKRIVDGILEIRTARLGRRTALSEWTEENQPLVAYVFLGGR